MFLSTQYFRSAVVNKDGKEGRGSLWASLSQNWGRMACHDVTGLCIWSTLISHFFQISPDSTFGGWHLFGLGWTLHGLQGVIVWQTRCWIEIRFSVEGVEFCIWWHSICREIFCEFRFQISRGAFFVWRAPMLSWPRIMCSQVSLLKFLEPSQEMPLILSEGKKTALDCP